MAYGLACGLMGCSSLGYLLQAGRGQMALIQHARPIEEVLRDEKTSSRLRTLLSEISGIKAYGETLGLRPTKNYIEFVKLDRPAAVWVVSACEPLKFQSREWHFPIVGSFPYLGWFELSDAKKFADELKQQGWDVDVRGAGAYSTLGWFRDAVLSSMIPEGEEALGELVNVVLHESVHATLYISGQAFFNESVASFAADRMTRDWLNRFRGSESEQSKAYLSAVARSDERRQALHDAYEQLARVYESSVSDSEKKRQKDSLLAQVKQKLQFRREITNATLMDFKEYHAGSKDFETLFEACGSDWKRFFSALAKLKPESFEKRQQQDLGSVLGPMARSCR